MANPRQMAFDAIGKILKDRQYSNLKIAGALEDSSLEGADKALFTAIVYGVIERRITLDYNLSLCLKQPLKKLNSKVYVSLLIGAYQLLFMDRIPDYAAINESVKLVRKNGASFAASLTNAVLRNIQRNGLKLPDEEDRDAYLSIKYSCPEYLVKMWMEQYGEEDAEGIMAEALGARPLTVRVNTLRVSTDELISELETAGVTVRRHPLVEDALILESGGSVEEMDAFKQGKFHVQDASSQLCVKRLDPQPGDTVLDVCAAPGGKSCTIAERMENRGEVFAFDLYGNRLKLIKENAERLGADIVSTKLGNAEVFDDSLVGANRILADVPCAGLGVIGRKPEIRYKDPAEIDNLPPLQYNILDNVWKYLTAGGRLVYSTCSLNREENESVVNRFLEATENAVLISMETLMPHKDGCDGFFIAVLEKKE